MNKLTCIILDDYQNAAIRFADWNRLAERIKLEVLNDHIDSEIQLAQKLKNADIVIVMRERTPLTKNLLSQLPNLKLIITSGMRNSSIDMKFAAEKNIVVCGTASSSEPPLELTWALILNLARQINLESQNLRDNKAWQSTVGLDLKGKQLGILGLGKIGSKMAMIGKAFGMQVVAWSQNLTPEIASKQGVTLAPSKEDLLRTSDIVTIHLILSDRTRGLLNADDLKKMKSNSLLINTSRGAIIEEQGLVQALENNWIQGAAVDVFEQEPLPVNHVFRTLPNLLATPHLGYVTESNYKVYFTEAIEDIEAFLNKNPLRRLN